MKEIILRIIILIISLVFVLSCQGNDINIELVTSCSDNVQNGDETGIDCGGTCSNICPPENAIYGEIVSVLNLTSNKVYTLTGPLLVRDGGQLIIQAGTLIKVQSGINAYIAIAQGGKFYAYGRADAPIVITSNAESPAAGDWGGIVICGKAPINSDEVGRSDLLDIFYGGSDITDTSGFIKYLRVEFTGAKYDNSKNFNGISFYGVGSYMTVNHVQSYNTLGNAFEFIGGNVKTKQMISINSNANAIALRDGWNGEGDNWYLSGSSKAGIRIANNATNESASPLTTGIISNVSLVGQVSGEGIHYTEGGGMVTFNNIYTSGLNLGVNINGNLASSLVETNNLIINNIQFDFPTTDFIITNHTGSNTGFYSESNTLGAGNKEMIPDWASNWTVGF